LFDGLAALSADGRHVTIYWRNDPLTVWDAATGKRLKTLSDGNVAAVAYSPDGRRVAAIVSGDPSSIRLWDLGSGKELWHRDLAVWYAGWADEKTLAFSPDGKAVALTHWRNVRIWDAATGKESPTFDGHRWPITALEFSEKGDRLISADSACVCEWDARHQQLSRHPLLAYHGWTLSTAESHAANLRVFQPDKGRPQLRELLTDKLLGEIKGLEGSWAGRFSADGRTVALYRTEEGKMEVAFVDVPSRKVRSRAGIDEVSPQAVALSADGKTLAVGCAEQTVLVIDSASGKVARRLGTPRLVPEEDQPRIVLTAGVFSPDGRILAFGTYLQRPFKRFQFGNTKDRPGVRVWHAASGGEMRQFEGCIPDAQWGRAVDLRFTPDNKSLALALSFNPSRVRHPDESVARVLEVASGRIRRRFQGHTTQVHNIAISPDGRTLATGGQDAAVLLWDLTRPARPHSGKAADLWKELAGTSPEGAYDAVLAMTVTPAHSVPFLAVRLKPAPAPAKEIAGWIMALDDEDFEARDRAFQKLAEAGEPARPALLKALAAKPPLDPRRRIEKLLGRLDAIRPSAAHLQALRGIEVLERIGSKEARRLLSKLAAGAAGAAVTEEAKAALERLRAGR
jgi:WD40 repeat protein